MLPHRQQSEYSSIDTLAASPAVPPQVRSGRKQRRGKSNLGRPELLKVVRIAERTQLPTFRHMLEISGVPDCPANIVSRPLQSDHDRLARRGQQVCTCRCRLIAKNPAGPPNLARTNGHGPTRPDAAGRCAAAGGYDTVREIESTIVLPVVALLPYSVSEQPVLPSAT